MWRLFSCARGSLTTQLLAVLIVAALAVGCGGGGPKYDVTVVFNDTVEQAGLDATAAYLRGFDDDVDVLIQESFPPVARAVVETDAPDFCATITAELEGRPYVERVTCEKV